MKRLLCVGLSLILTLCAHVLLTQSLDHPKLIEAGVIVGLAAFGWTGLWLQEWVR